MMVSAVRHGTPMRSVARRFHVSLNTVQRWVRRAQGQRLSRVEWTDRPAGCRRSPLVRAELSFAKKRIAFYSLRRRAYDEQDVLNEVRYEPPNKRFSE